MIEAAKAEQGQLILVVLGPLTNVALACKLDSQLPSRSKLAPAEVGTVITSELVMQVFKAVT